MNLKNNAKVYSLIFLLAFLVVQVSLVSHATKHDILDHNHAGKQCEQCVFAKNYKADTPSSVPVNVDSTEYKFSYNTQAETFITIDLLGGNPARAPPLFS